MRAGSQGARLAAGPGRRRSPLRARLEARAFGVAVGRLGMSIDNTRILEVAGRRTGTIRATPVRLLEVNGTRYLVGLCIGSEWPANLRAARIAKLRKGRSVVQAEAVELPAGERPTILRAYLMAATRPKTLSLLGGGSRNPTDTHLAAIAADHPVFRIRVID